MTILQYSIQLKSPIMNLKLLTSLCFFIFTMSTANAQISRIINDNPYWEGEIVLNDGTVKKGFIMVPHASREKSIDFKTSLKAKKEKIKRKEIATVKLTSDTGISYVYENIPAIPTITGKASIGTSLLLVQSKNSYATFYVESQTYKIDRKAGKIILFYEYVQGSDFPSISYYIRKKDAPKASLLYTTGHLGGLKKGVRHHMTETPELIEKVENKEYKENDIPELISEYLKATEGM